jgi:hypothetical protein
VKWGTPETFVVIDNKDVIFGMFKLKTSLHEFETIQDPCPGKDKIIRVECPSKDFSLNYNDTSNGVIDVYRDFFFGGGVYTIDDPDKKNLFKNLVFGIQLDPIAKLSTYIRRNVIHIRNESDFVDFLSKREGQCHDTYLSNLNKKYIDAIERHISNAHDEITIVLTSQRENNEVIRWMNEHKYYLNMNIYGIDENGSSTVFGREKRALYDMILASNYCNHVFIGHHQSSYSKWLDVRLDHSQTVWIE